MTSTSIWVSLFVFCGLMTFAKVPDQMRANANNSVRLVCRNKAGLARLVSTGALFQKSEGRWMAGAVNTIGQSKRGVQESPNWQRSESRVSRFLATCSTRFRQELSLGGWAALGWRGVAVQQMPGALVSQRFQRMERTSAGARALHGRSGPVPLHPPAAGAR